MIAVVVIISVKKVEKVIKEILLSISQGVGEGENLSYN